MNTIDLQTQRDVGAGLVALLATCAAVWLFGLTQYGGMGLLVALVPGMVLGAVMFLVGAARWKLAVVYVLALAVFGLFQAF